MPCVWAQFLFIVGVVTLTNEATGLYEKYRMKNSSAWAQASVELVQSESDTFDFPGFPNTESALVYLTHPLAGFYVSKRQ